MPTSVRYVKYVCANDDCKSEDTDKVFDHENPFPVLNCWNCKAGFAPRMDIGEMLTRRVGMYPLLEKDNATKRNYRQAPRS